MITTIFLVSYKGIVNLRICMNARMKMRQKIFINSVLGAETPNACKLSISTYREKHHVVNRLYFKAGLSQVSSVKSLSYFIFKLNIYSAGLEGLKKYEVKPPRLWLTLWVVGEGVSLVGGCPHEHVAPLINLRLTSPLLQRVRSGKMRFLRLLHHQGT